METSFLESRLEESSHEPPTYNMEPSRSLARPVDRDSTSQGDGDDAGGLEMWGWSGNLTDWSPEQKSLLLSSWRPSTLKTYKVAWNRWCRWAHDNDLNISSPTGSSLARFLSDLHQKEGLAYSTILVHKSVVSSLCDADKSEALSSHKLVKQVLKAIALQKPKEPKPPIWDVANLVLFLSSRKFQQDNLYEVARHTAALLLLCSGRRVHDLTLLCIDSDHMTDMGSHIILWPRFGSKTDSSDTRQSGWKLLPNTQCNQADPIYWIKQLIEISRQRREVCKSSKLFLTVIGKPREASRTIIAGWVKSLLREAGIEATPGSVRAAVASRNWIDNFPLDSILQQGNWRSEDTFRRFYRREISRADHNVNNLSNLFEGV
ncbi:uncharacterized protein [Choristoneura fumiferana]|uniref:uncharacterized protein n=1 Tax=Choristoneura fumiferana TaxID=7141 RepID=UPI003D15BF44